MSRNIGDVQMFVNWIIGAVLFTLLFLAGNTMSQSVRDRLSELGVLKALGFGNTSVWLLIVAEAAVLSFVAAAIGLAVAAAVFPSVFKSLAGGPVALPLSVYAVGLRDRAAAGGAERDASRHPCSPPHRRRSAVGALRR